MTVFLRDTTVTVVYVQLGSLVTADLPCGLDGVLFVVEVPRRPLSAAFLDVPSTVRIRNNMMRVFGHFGLTSQSKSQCTEYLIKKSNSRRPHGAGS